jgi:WhiB family transcriptional regulator, redox-sensing transcriptional regulator
MSLVLAPLGERVESGAGVECGGKSASTVKSASTATSASTAKSALPCRNFDPDLWFADSPAELELAKAMCADCPLRIECLAGALERGEPWGVWGGEIFERGAVVPRKRPRGRPRKDDVARDAVLRVEVAARTAAAMASAAA